MPANRPTYPSSPELSAEQLRRLVITADAPLIVDVRPHAADDCLIAGACRRDPVRVTDWGPALPARTAAVVYGASDEPVAAHIAARLSALGHRAMDLAGGMAAWRRIGGPRVGRHRYAEPGAPPSRWITHRHPRIDRVACPWLVRRFVDPRAEFHYAPAEAVLPRAAALDAVPFDVPGVPFSHHGGGCSFDSFVTGFAIVDPVLAKLARIVRGADLEQPDLAPQSAALQALVEGLAATTHDDAKMLADGCAVLDELYRWCRDHPGA